MVKSEQPVLCADGTTLKATRYSPEPEHESIGAILIAGALGVPERYYSGFANFLAEKGFEVLTFEYRGTTGNDREKESEISLDAWGSQDIDSMIRMSISIASGNPVHLIGHSIGAQLLGLAEHARQLAGAVFVGASFPHWRRWPLRQRARPFVLFNVLIPVIGRLMRRVPAKVIGLGSGELPSGVLRQWASWTRSDAYLRAPEHGIRNAERYDGLALSVLALEFDDDNLVPLAAAKALYDGYPSVKFEVRRKISGNSRVGHFGFFRQASGEKYWSEVIDWLSTGEK
ncbi:hydrolase [Burkholderia sp. SRS-46]|nr:hydrolase [Burkholderia sp. SRS-46]